MIRIENGAQLEFFDRQHREATKAVQKYGTLGQLPTGHPDRDIHDYAINELVGLSRYADMIAARHELLNDVELRQSGVELAERISEQSAALAVQLIQLRRNLAAVGLLTGQPEQI